MSEPCWLCTLGRLCKKKTQKQIRRKCKFRPQNGNWYEIKCNNINKASARDRKRVGIGGDNKCLLVGKLMMLKMNSLHAQHRSDSCSLWSDFGASINWINFSRKLEHHKKNRLAFLISAASMCFTFLVAHAMSWLAHPARQLLPLAAPTRSAAAHSKRTCHNYSSTHSRSAFEYIHFKENSFEICVYANVICCRGPLASPPYDSPLNDKQTSSSNKHFGVKLVREKWSNKVKRAPGMKRKKREKKNNKKWIN